MKIRNMAKAVVLSITMVTGAFAFAELSSTDRSDSKPNRPNHSTYSNQDAQQRNNKMCDSDTMPTCCAEMSSCCETTSSCCEAMHEQGCSDMMGKSDSSEASGDE